MDKYKINYDTRWWECGDKCCSDQLTTITVNDIEIGTFSFFNEEESFDFLINELNKNDKEITIHSSVELDEDDNLTDAFYFNGIKQDSSVYDMNKYFDLLSKLKLNYRYIASDLDWDIWKQEERLVLETKEEYIEFDEVS